MQKLEEYTCSKCGKTKNDTNSRYSFVDRTMTDKLCWECTRIADCRRQQHKILRNIDKELDKIDKLDAEIKQYIKDGGKE